MFIHLLAEKKSFIFKRNSQIQILNKVEYYLIFCKVYGAKMCKAYETLSNVIKINFQWKDATIGFYLNIISFDTLKILNVSQIK